MLRKHYQSLVRLLSIATVSTGMLLAQANLVVPAVSTVWAAEPATTTTQATHADTSSIPESNPYADSTQCVYRAWDLAAKAGHKLPWFAGNAKDWREGAKKHGLTVVDTIDPSVVNSVAIWDAGVGGAGDAGHVAWVVEVKGNRFRVQERNWIPASDGERWVTWEKGISFIKFDEPQPAQAEPADAAPAQEASPAQGASAAGAASPAAPASQPISPAERLLEQFSVQHWAPSQPTADSLRTPLPGLTGRYYGLARAAAPLAQPVPSA